MYEYKVTLDRVVDGDTCDVNIDLGFEIWLAKQRVRLYGLDTWESRTRNLSRNPSTAIELRDVKSNEGVKVDD